MTISQISTDLNECYAGCMFIQGVLIKRVENKTRLAIGSAAPVVQCFLRKFQDFDVI